MTQYEDVYHRSLAEPEEFWLAAARNIDWEIFPTQAADARDAPFHRWFSDGELNTCYNALDRHVLAGRDSDPALIYDSPMTGEAATYTYAELLAEVAAFAGVLSAHGVTRGDRVVIYMPMIPEAAIAMLACARIGAIHSVVFGGFAPAELAARIEDAQPVAIVSASCGIEPNRIIPYLPLLDEAQRLSSHEVAVRVIKQRPQAPAELQSTDIDWDTAMEQAVPVDCVPVSALDPLYILYTSGTTGRPKGVVRDNGGHAVALRWSMPTIYGIDPGDVFWAASDVGWVVGHSYIVYAPLLTGATTVLYEGKPVGTPDAGAFGRVIAQHGVKALFTAPTAIRAIRKEDPTGSALRAHDLSTLEALYLAGERLDIDTYEWATEVFGVPVIDNWWQTETGWPIAANPRGIELLPIRPGSPTVPMPGYDVQVLDGSGQPVPPGTEGNIVIGLPLPPGTLPTLWGDDRRFFDSYLAAFPGYYTSGDGGYLDDDGYVNILGRTDDVINVAGHRLSTGAMEGVVSSHPLVAECAVIGVADALKGQVPRAFVVLQAGAQVDPTVLADEIITAVRSEIGPVAALKSVVVVPALPKTRSGKILRRTMRGIADGRNEPVPSTIEDASVLDTITPLLSN